MNMHIVASSSQIIYSKLLFRVPESLRVVVVEFGV